MSLLPLFQPIGLSKALNGDLRRPLAQELLSELSDRCIATPGSFDSTRLAKELKRPMCPISRNVGAPGEGCNSFFLGQGHRVDNAVDQIASVQHLLTDKALKYLRKEITEFRNCHEMKLANGWHDANGSRADSEAKHCNLDNKHTFISILRSELEEL